MSKKIQIISALFILLSIWWIFIINYAGDYPALVWAASYQIVALVGAIFGLFISKWWGGLRSVVGKSIISFSLGLFLQVFGQTVFSFYNLVLKVEIPYPSLADIGFFGSIPLYIIGVIYLARASGTNISLKAFTSKLQAVVIPLIGLIVSYFIFLRSYEYDWSHSLRVFFDFAYPLGQVFYISLAILVYLLSRKILGGVMKFPVLIILAALVIQYVADYNFLFQVANGTWVNGWYGDYLYLLAYFIMSIAILGFDKKRLISE